MGAEQYLNPEEFAQTFLPTHWGDDWGEASAEVFLNDPGHQASLTDSVRTRGVQEPVRVTPRSNRSKYRYVVDGHHRVAAAITAGQPIPYQNFGGESDDPEPRELR